MAEPTAENANRPDPIPPGGPQASVWTVVRRLAGFALLPLPVLVMPLLLMPIIGTLVGSDGWSSALAGQSIGTIASVVILWGWNVDGTVRVATATSAEERSSLYARSMRTRLLLSALALPVASAATLWVVHPAYRDAGVAMMLAYLLLGLSPSWFCIGLGRPTLLGYYDTIPRVLGTLLAAPLLLWTRSLWPFPLLMACCTGAALALFHRRFAPSQPWLPLRLRETVHDLAAQRHTAGINLTGQVYAQTPTPIATATTSSVASGSLATADSLYRLGLFSVAALGNAFQSWTLEPGADRRNRHLAAIATHLGLGVIGIAALVFLGPPISPLISGGAAPASPLLFLYYGVAFAFISATTPLIRNLLIPAGKQSLVLRATLIAAIVGVAVMMVSGLARSVDGIAIGMALSEVAMFVVLLPQSLRILNRTRMAPHP